MDHTKKFVLVDPRFVRPSMRDKLLSGLDSDISNILKSDEPDEVKVRNYMTALTRYKNYSTPPKSPPPEIPQQAPQPTQAIPAVPPVIQFKVTTPSKRSGKRVKIEPLDSDSSLAQKLWRQTHPSLDQQSWRRTQRKQKQKKFGSQWIEYSPKKKNKFNPPWIEQ